MSHGCNGNHRHRRYHDSSLQLPPVQTSEPTWRRTPKTSDRLICHSISRTMQYKHRQVSYSQDSTVLDNTEYRLQITIRKTSCTLTITKTYYIINITPPKTLTLQYLYSVGNWTSVPDLQKVKLLSILHM